ncbi:MAG: phytanoyl-CoA dioxygenase family protein [Acidimicrobiales bacterium]
MPLAYEGTDLLTTAEMAQFVAQGFLSFESVVPEEINEAAIAEFAPTGVFDLLRAKPDSGAPLAQIYPDPSPIGAMLRLPRVQGIIESLVGLDAVYDHDWVHVRAPHDTVDQHLHQDAIIDLTRAFDIQMFWYPRAVETHSGGTGFIPGSHLRKVNEFEIARYQNFCGQKDFVGPAGSLVVFHQGMWHRGRANHTDDERWAYKIRLNPTTPQVRRWNLEDYDAVHGTPSDHIFATYDPATAANMFRTPEPWFEAAASRLETVNRARLWRYLTGDQAFDADWYLTRTGGRERIDGTVG